jgi:DeoR/GlpR family transcriptional regulator of sugar metabolism
MEVRNMLKKERQNHIVKQIETQGTVIVKDLAGDFGVSLMTIRRDLEEIEELGLVERIHGGALLGTQSGKQNELPRLDRMDIMLEEKQKIAEYLAGMIAAEEMVFLGSGTTTLYVAKAIAARDDISVVTNSLTVLNELASNGKMTLIGIGGFLRRSEYSMIGHFTENAIQDLHVDKVIMGMRGIHPRFGLTSEHPQELITDRVILSICENVIIVADHSKIGHVATSRTAPITAARTIVTTQNAREDIVNAIRSQEVEVILV